MKTFPVTFSQINKTQPMQQPKKAVHFGTAIVSDEIDQPLLNILKLLPYSNLNEHRISSYGDAKWDGLKKIAAILNLSTVPRTKGPTEVATTLNDIEIKKLLDETPLERIGEFFTALNKEPQLSLPSRDHDWFQSE